MNVKMDQCDKYLGEELALKAELEQYKKDLEMEKKNHTNDVNEKEREKVQATEKMRKDMLYKIKETKANLLALNDE